MTLRTWGDLDQPPQEQQPLYLSPNQVAARLRQVVKDGPESITADELEQFAQAIEYWNLHGPVYDR